MPLGVFEWDPDVRGEDNHISKQDISPLREDLVANPLEEFVQRPTPDGLNDRWGPAQRHNGGDGVVLFLHR